MKKTMVVVALGLAVACWGETRDEAIAHFKEKVVLAKKTGDKKLITNMEEALKCYEDKTAVKDEEVMMCQTLFLSPADQKRVERLK